MCATWWNIRRRFDQTRSHLDKNLPNRQINFSKVSFLSTQSGEPRLAAGASSVLVVPPVVLRSSGFSTASYLKVHIRAHRAAQTHHGHAYLSGRPRSVEGKPSSAPRRLVCSPLICLAAHRGGRGRGYCFRSNRCCVLHVCTAPCHYSATHRVV